MGCKIGLHGEELIVSCERLEGIECCGCCPIEDDCADSMVKKLKCFKTPSDIK